MKTYKSKKSVKAAQYLGVESINDLIEIAGDRIVVKNPKVLDELKLEVYLINEDLNVEIPIDKTDWVVDDGSSIILMSKYEFDEEYELSDDISKTIGVGSLIDWEDYIRKLTITAPQLPTITFNDQPNDLHSSLTNVLPEKSTDKYYSLDSDSNSNYCAITSSLISNQVNSLQNQSTELSEKDNRVS